MSPDLFVGRGAEIELLRRKMAAAVGGRRLEPVFLSGSRGMGKSSLASLALRIARRDYRLLAAHVYLGGVTSLDEMARRVFDRLLKDNWEAPWWGKLRDLLGDFVRQLSFIGVTVEFRPPREELPAITQNLGELLVKFLDRVGDDASGFFLVLDDINGLAQSAEFANWLKSFVDETAVSGRPLPLCLVVVGLPERRDALIRLQPSLARVFDVLALERLSDPEAREFYRRAFESVGVTLDDDALDLLTEAAYGLPAFLHEVGDAAFYLDDDGHVDADDAWEAVEEAAKRIGEKYVEPQVLRALRSPIYENILQRILSSDEFEAALRRSDLRHALPEEERRNLDNFLRRMEKLGVLERDEDEAGSYIFSDPLTYLYLRLRFTAAHSEER